MVWLSSSSARISRRCLAFLIGCLSSHEASKKEFSDRPRRATSRSWNWRHPERVRRKGLTQKAVVSNSELGLACIGHKSLEICDRCRLWQRNSPATPENSAAFWIGEFKNSLFQISLS